MRAERWRAIEELYHAVREREPGERDRFLQDAGVDATVRSEVESLLGCESQADSFLEDSALEVTARALAEGRAQSMLGRVLGHYEIVAFLGAGGMGEVYRARDLRLDREVALKFLSAGFAHHPLFLERFRLEARAASALNHPHICTVYDIGETDGQRFIVMELLRGSTLASRIERRPLPLQELLEFGIEIAGALAAAHDHGIVHRDIKAGNIFLVDRPGELPLAKILDFGLAKLAGELPGAGMAFGTLAYMSPEQTRGLEVDARSDLFSFGVVLYEMATGVFPFADAAHARERDAVLHQTPTPASRLNPGVPAGLDRIIGKALEKNPDARYQTAGDLRTDLKRLRLETDSGSLPSSPANGKIASPRWIYGLVAAIILLASAGSWIWHFRAAEGSPSNDWLRLTDFSDSATQPALSPDGRWLTFIRGELTFATQGQVYVKRMPDGEPVPLTHESRPKLSPVFSPDGLRIAYGLRDPWDTWVVPRSGGESRLMLANTSGLRWIDRDHILFSEIKSGAHMALATARDSGAGKRDVYVPAHERGMAHRSALSPDGRWVLLAEMDNSGWLPCRVAPYDGRDMGRPIGIKGKSCTDVAWSPDGRWMYFSSDATGAFHIWRQQFAGGEPRQFTFGIGTEEGIAMAPDGRSLVTSVGEEQREIWYRQGKQERRISSEGLASNPQVSADGRRIYYVLRHGGNPQRMGFMSGELWRADLATGRNEPLLPGKIVTGFDISADGQQITYSTGQPGEKSEIWLAPMDGGKLPRRVPNSSGMFPRFGASGDLYYMAVEGKLNFLYRIKEDGSGRQKVSRDSILALMRVSPDGKWAYVWGASQDRRGSTGFLLYPTGGGAPVDLCGYCSVAWSPDARRLYVSPGSIIEETGASFVIPFDRGPSPSLAAAGGDSAEKLRLLAGARVIEHSIVAPGPDPESYAFVKVMIHRNLYRVPIR